jgi:two-component system, cell cycle sensor histidine kinase and response regulator CckA
MHHFDFEKLVERLPLVVYVDSLDEKSSPLWISPQIEKLLGYDAAEWVADPDLFVRSIHPDDRERVLGDIARRNERLDSSPSADYRLVARDGRVVWVRDDEIVVPGENGAPPVAQGYLLDVSDRRHDSMRLELLVGILGLAAEERSPAEIVAGAARILAHALGDVKVTFVDVAGGELRMRHSTESGAVDDSFRIPGYLERLAAGPIVVDDVTQADWLADVEDSLAAQEVGAAVDIPLLRDGELVGALWFNTAEPRRWEASEVATLTEVAEQLAMVLETAEAREERARSESALRTRDTILQAVARAAEDFLASDDADRVLSDLVRVLGEATGATMAYVFENVPLPQGGTGALRLTSWTRAGWVDTVDDPRLGHLRPAPHFPRWASLLGAGEVLTGLVRDLPEDERDALAMMGSKSVAAVPVVVEGEWWGFIGFEDFEREREWSAAETDALRTAAGLVAAAVERGRSQRSLARKDAILEAVSSAAHRLLAEPHWRDAAPDVLRRLGEAADVSRAYLFETVSGPDEPLTLSQRFEWAASGVRADIDDPSLQDLALADAGLTEMAERLEAGHAYRARRSEAAPGERAMLEDGEIQAILIVPILVGGAPWGVIGFDDCAAERDFSPGEADALRAAASLFAAAIVRERSERSLREHEQKLRAVWDTALDAIFITDDERRYVDVNPAACEYYGVPRAELVGRRIDDFLPAHKLETLEEDWAAYLAGGPILAEWEIQRADGNVRVAEASAHPHFLPGLHIAFFRDATERRRLEAELAHAQRLDSLGRLAGGVAHDFNNLLTGITGYAALLLERANGDGELSRDLTEIKRAAERAADLTKQLLAFGRRQVLKPRPLDLNAVLDETALLLRRLLGEHVQLEVRTAPDLGTVRADPGQVEQVVVNLVVNARDAMPDGGTVVVETRNAGDVVELAVSDTGVGMDDETLGRVFEPFFTTREEGMGLGLASVHGIVHQSGGEVWVESAPGEGTTFVVRLPRVAEVAERPLPAPSPEPAAGTGTILLVEDEDVVRELARRVLERQGYTVLPCANGAEAVALADADDRPIDLLLTDVVMPGLRGYEVAQRVSATRPGIKILYMSGYAEEAFVGRATISGTALIEKPFAIDALTRRVRETLDTP